MTASCCTALWRATRRNSPTSCAIRESRSRSVVTHRGLWTSKAFRSPEWHPSSPIKGEFDGVGVLRLKRFPEYAALPPPVFREGALLRISPQPSSSGVVLLRIAPEIISVLDYSKRFGHSDLVTFSERDLDQHIDSLRHRWDGNSVVAPSTTEVLSKPGKEGG
jgi:hypothetical protein